MSSTLAIDILARGGSAAAAEMGKVARATDKTGAALKKNSKISDAAAKASLALTKAHGAESDALDKVQIAEAKLSDVRQAAKDRTGKVQAAEKMLLAVRNDTNSSTSQITAAESKLQSARAAANTSTTRVLAGEKALAKARREAATAGDVAQKAAKDLGKVLDHEGKNAGKGFLGSLKSVGKEVPRVVKGWFSGDGSSVFRQLGQNVGGGFMASFLGVLKTPVIGPAVAAVLIAAVEGVAVPAGAVLAGGVVAGFGAGIAGLGLVFAAKSEVIKSIWSKTASDLGAQMRTIAKPFESTLAAMSVVARRTFAGLKPQLAAAFKTLGPAMSGFGDQLGRALGKLGPALQPLAGAFKGVLASLGPAMNQVFEQLSSSLTKLSASISKNPTALADFAKGVGGLVADLVNFLTIMNNADAAFKRWTGGTSAVTALMYVLRSAVAGVTGPIALLAKGFSAVGDGMNWLAGKLGIGTQVMDQSGDAATAEASALAKAAAAAQAHAAATAHSAHVTHTANAAAALLAGAYDRQTAATDKAIGALNRMSSLLLTLSGAQIAYQQAVDDASAAIKENGKTHDINTQKGRDNKTALLQVAASATAQRDAMLKANDGNVKAAASATSSQAAFVKLATQMGYTVPQAKAMANSLIKIPNVTRTAKLTANKADLDKKLADARTALKDPKLTATKRAKLEAEIRQLKTAVAEAQNAINGLHGKTVTLKTIKETVETHSSEGLVASGKGLPGRARGGPVIKGQSYIVGEKKAEVFTPNQDGTILPEVPSRGLGSSVATGMAQGLAGGTSSAVSAAASLAGQIIDKARQVLGIQSPSKAFVKLGIFVNQGFAQGLRGSAKQVQSVMKQLVGKLIDLSYNVGASKSRAINRVLGSLGRESKALQGLAAQRLKVAGQLKNAQAKLAAVLKERGEFSASIRDAAISFNAITNIQAPEDRDLVAGDVISRMRETLAKTREFASKLARLKATGLGPVLYRQIAEAGVEQGSSLAEALLSGGKGAINEANSLQTQIGRASAGLGTTAANNLYQAGVDGAQGLVNGLLAKTKALDAASKKLAATIVAAIKKQLGIKSPSRVLAKMGAYTGQGFVEGIEDTYDAVRKAGRGLGDSVQPGSRPAIRGNVSSGSSVTVPIQFVLDGRVIQQTLLKVKQNNGGLELGLA
jgi:hypothetical protein